MGNHQVSSSSSSFANLPENQQQEISGNHHDLILQIQQQQQMLHEGHFPWQLYHQLELNDDLSMALKVQPISKQYMLRLVVMDQQRTVCIVEVKLTMVRQRNIIKVVTHHKLTS